MDFRADEVLRELLLDFCMGGTTQTEAPKTDETLPCQTRCHLKYQLPLGLDLVKYHFYKLHAL